MSYFTPNEGQIQSRPISTGISINSIMKMVYLWMFLGMLTTAGVAYFTANLDFLASLRTSTGASILSIVVLFGTVIGLNVGITRQWMTPNLAAGLFFLFSAIMGFSLSLTLQAFLDPTLSDGTVNPLYDPGAVYAAFGTTAALFGSMTMFAFTTRMDLTKWGTYLFMGLIGLIIAMFVNMLLGSETLGFIISFAGVLLFTALTAYDTQKIEQMSRSPELQSNGDLAFKFSIIGAVTLYLDFINLFLFLLRLFAGGRD